MKYVFDLITLSVKGKSVSFNHGHTGNSVKSELKCWREEFSRVQLKHSCRTFLEINEEYCASDGLR